MLYHTPACIYTMHCCACSLDRLQISLFQVQSTIPLPFTPRSAVPAAWTTCKSARSKGPPTPETHAPPHPRHLEGSTCHLLSWWRPATCPARCSTRMARCCCLLIGLTLLPPGEQVGWGWVAVICATVGCLSDSRVGLWVVLPRI